MINDEIGQLPEDKEIHSENEEEAFRSKMSQLCSAAEAAEMIIRVDDIIRNAPRQREG